MRLPHDSMPIAPTHAMARASAKNKRVVEMPAPATQSPAPAGGNANGERFETKLDAVAGKADSERWNSLRRMKWCNDPLAEERLV